MTTLLSPLVSVSLVVVGAYLVVVPLLDEKGAKAPWHYVMFVLGASILMSQVLVTIHQVIR